MPFAALTGFSESIVSTAESKTAALLEEEKGSRDDEIEPESFD